MKSNVACLLFLLFLLGIKPSYSQSTSASKAHDYVSLGLTDAIEKGLRKNYNEIDRKKGREVLELNWNDSWEEFWLPQVSLSFTSSNQRVARLKRGDPNNTALNERTPLGNLGLSFGDYTLFNWGKDYLAYLSTRENYLRSDRNFKEATRALKHEIIIKYFELIFRKGVFEARRQQLRHAAFVYRFNREKVAIKKIGRQEYYQSRAEYLKAQNDFNLARRQEQVAQEEMAFLISDEPGTKYLLLHDLNYKKISTTLNEAINLSKETNPDLLDAKADVSNTKRDLEIIFKDNLPLPKISINLGAYNYRFDRNSATGRYSTGVNNGQLDVVASISASWALTGPGGLLNSRKVKRSTIEKHRAFNILARARHQTFSEIRRHFLVIKDLEEQIKVLAPRTENLEKAFDVILENYLNRKTSFLHFQDTLIEMVETNILMAQFLFFHTREKVLLASEMGRDDFPGDSFEQLGKRRSKK